VFGPQYTAFVRLIHRLGSLRSKVPPGLYLEVCLRCCSGIEGISQGLSRRGHEHQRPVRVTSNILVFLAWGCRQILSKPMPRAANPPAILAAARWAELPACNFIQTIRRLQPTAAVPAPPPRPLTVSTTFACTRPGNAFGAARGLWYHRYCLHLKPVVAMEVGYAEHPLASR